MSKRDIADKRQTLPEGRISLTEAVTWLAYGKLRNRDRIRRIERFCEIDMNARNITKDEMVKRSNKGYPKRTREEKFEKIRNRINEAFSSLLPKLQADKIQAFGVLVDKYHWEQMPKTIAAVPSKIEIAVFSKTTIFRYGADAIDLVLGKEGDDEGDRLWKRGVAESYSGFIAIEVNAAELAREFVASLLELNEATPLDNTVAEMERVSARRMLPASEDENLAAFLKNWANDEEHAGRSFSADRAWPAAEAHFDASISREHLRTLAINAGLGGRRGRPRNSADNSAEK